MGRRKKTSSTSNVKRPQSTESLDNEANEQINTTSLQPMDKKPHQLQPPTLSQQSFDFYDKYLVFCVLTGISLFLYCLMGGDYPFNAFLGAFIYAVGCFVMIVNLKHMEKRAHFLEFVGCIVVLHGFVSNYMG